MMHFYIKIITILFMFYFGLNGIFGFIYILLDAETRSDVNRGVLFIFLAISFFVILITPHSSFILILLYYTFYQKSTPFDKNI